MEQKKIDRAVRFIQSIFASQKEGDEPIELAYSGGKNSDVCLELCKMAGVKPIIRYKNTTIDKPGTIAHCKEVGAIITPPRNGITFFKIIQQKGLPSMFSRFCCKDLKEYYTAPKVIVGIRKYESVKRMKRYTEPTECRVYDKSHKTEYFLPILDWTDEDVYDFIKMRGLKICPLYYTENGDIDVKKRVGCMGCPLQYYKKRLEYFKKYPKLVRQYLRNLKIYWETHPNIKAHTTNNSFYECFYRQIFFYSDKKFRQWREENHHTPEWYKEEMERYFNVNLDFK